MRTETAKIRLTEKMRTTTIRRIVKKVIGTKIRKIGKITIMEDIGGGQITTATVVENRPTQRKNAQQGMIRVISVIYQVTGQECATKENKEGKTTGNIGGTTKIGGITKIGTPITEIVRMTTRE